MATAHERKMYGLLAVIGLSTPSTLLVETAIRHLLLPPEFEQVRAWLGPQVTPWVWAMVPSTLLATALGVPLQRYLYRSELAERCVRLGPARAHDKAIFESLMLSTSAPQFPALLAALGFLCGASLVPVLLTIALATAGVFALGFFLPAPPVQLDASASRTPG